MYEIFRRHSIVRQVPHNDRACGWVETLRPPGPAQRLTDSQRADWAVIGAGLSGLVAARRLKELYPDRSIALVEAQRAGESSSGRNSGFAIEISPPRGMDFQSSAPREVARKLKPGYQINMAGVSYLRDLVSRYSIDCEWQEIGKFHGAVSAAHASQLDGFAEVLDVLEVPHERQEAEALRSRLGTSYYRHGLWTGQSVLLQPAALSRGLADSLRDTIDLYEESPVEEIDYGAVVTIRCREGRLEADNVIVATNGLLGEFGLFRHRSAHLVLTSCLTRPLSDEEADRMGNPRPWGLVSVSPMGATVRYTSDRRLLLRSTSEFLPQLSMSSVALQRYAPLYRREIAARWPELAGIDVEFIWSGVVAISANAAPVFAQCAPNVFAIGICNANGLSRGIAFGKLIVDHIAGVDSPALETARKLAQPTKLPPRPFLDWGVRSRMRKLQRLAGPE